MKEIWGMYTICRDAPTYFKVQTKLFELGYKWETSGKLVQLYNKEVRISIHEDGTISRSYKGLDTVSPSIRYPTYSFMTNDDIFNISSFTISHNFFRII